MNELRRYGPLLVSIWGWAALAVATADMPWKVVPAIVGLIASVAQQRAYRASAVVEALALVSLVALAPNDKLGFIAVGALLVVGARLILALVRRPEDG